VARRDGIRLKRHACRAISFRLIFIRRRCHRRRAHEMNTPERRATGAALTSNDAWASRTVRQRDALPGVVIEPGKSLVDRLWRG
jgi:hypothetical protein